MVEAGIDVVETNRVGQQPVHRQAALTIERDVARDVAGGHAGADIAALDGALLGDQPHRRKLETLRGMRQARGDRRAAAPRDRVGELERLRRSRHLEGVVDAAERHVASRLHRIDAARRDRVAGAELARQRELALVEIDGDDSRRAGRDRAQQRGEPDAAEADHGNAGAGADPRGVGDRADAGEHRAAEQGRLGERQLVVDPDQRAARADREFGEGGDAEVVVQGRARPA
jgi:hypothetical protein